MKTREAVFDAECEAFQDFQIKLPEQKQKLQELFESSLDKAMKGELAD